jgi:hypothetical protein
MEWEYIFSDMELEWCLANCRVPAMQTTYGQRHGENVLPAVRVESWGGGQTDALLFAAASGTRDSF